MKKFSLGLEVIDFQKDDIFIKFSSLFDALIKSKYENPKIVKDIEKLTLERFGTNIVLKILESSPIGSHVEVPTFNKNHVFFNNSIREYIQRHKEGNVDYDTLFKLQKFNEQNIVDLKKATVTGVFSKMSNAIGMDVKQIRQLSAEEVAAIYLHEVGHVFTFFEMMNKLTTVNLVMLSVTNAAEKNIPHTEKVMVFKKADELLNLPNDGSTQNEYVNNYKVVSTVYLSKIIRKNKSSTGSLVYDNVSAEQAADQFVSRLGGGRYLVIALDKLHRADGYPVTETDNYLWTIALSIFHTSSGFLFSLFGVAGYVIFVIYTAYLLLMLSYVFGNSMQNNTYDQPKIRFSRMRNDLMVLLKETKDDDYKRIILKEIQLCDDVIKNYDDNKMLYVRIADYIFNKTNVDTHKLQRDLEDIAFNDLFIKAEKLRLT